MTLKQIIAEMIESSLKSPKKENEKDYIIDKNGVAVIQIPMSFAAMRKTSLKESRQLMRSGDDFYKNHVKKIFVDKEHAGKSSKEISDHLHKHYGAHVSEEDSAHIKRYTDTETAKSMSHALIRAHKNGDDPKDYMEDDEIEAHDAIHRNAKPSEHEFHLHSGIGWRLGAAHEGSRNGLVHSPAHISATHDLGTASYFAHGAGKKDPDRYHHMMRVKIKKGDKILHVSRHSKYGDEEHETIIPAGTTLKHIKTTYHHHDGSEVHGAKPGDKYKLAMHHYEIHNPNSDRQQKSDYRNLPSADFHQKYRMSKAEWKRKNS